MAVGFAQIGTSASGTTQVTLGFPTTPIDHRLAVAFVDSGHPTAGTIPTCLTKGWAFVGSFEGGGGVYGADAGPRRISLFVRSLQGDGSDEAPTFTVPAGSESRVGGVILNLTFSVGQEVVRYRASFGEDTSSGTAFSVAGVPAIPFSGFTGDLAALFYAVATDAATWSAEAVAATGITFGTITERFDSQSAFGADASRAVATGAITAGGPAAETPTISATLSAASTGVAAMLLVQDLNPDGGPAFITAAFDPVLSRVHLSGTDFDPHATNVTIERSTDGVVWRPVRGGYTRPIDELPVVVDTFNRTVADGWGTCDTGQTATLSGGSAADYDVGSGVGTMALPDTATRSVSYDGVSIRNVEVTATGTVPATATGGPYEVDLMLRRTDSLNFYSCGANADTSGNIDFTIVKQVAGVFTTLVSLSNVVTYSPGDTIGMRFQAIGSRLRAKVWNETTGSEPGAWTAEAVDLSLNSAGSVGMRADRNSANTNVGLIPAFDNFAASQIGVELDDYEFVPGVLNTYRATASNDGMVKTDIETTTVTPVLDRIWLKSVTRPFLNRQVMVVGFTDPTRPERSNEHDVVNRTLPVAVNDLRSGRRWMVTLYVDNPDDAQTLDYILAAGDVLLLHTPLGCEVPGGYVQVKSYGQRHPAGRVRGSSRLFALPLVEVAPPGPDVLAPTSTWASVLAAFATWQDVLNTFPTWQDLLDFIGDPSEVIAE